MRLLCLAATAVSILFTAFPAAAQEPTNFSIYVKARDAKFVGNTMGGARVVIRDRVSGDILVEGVTVGGTGDTKSIMDDGRKRDAVMVDENTAVFEFSMDVFEPMAVTISATGPLAQPQSMVTVSEDFILLPGKDYTSENGIMLELPGMAVDITTPGAAQQIPFDAGIPVPIAARVAKLCGCEIAKDGMWPPERYEVEAHIYKDAMYIASVPLEYSGLASEFFNNLKNTKPGTFKVVVTAFDPLTKEAGMDSTTLVLVEKQTTQP